MTILLSVSGHHSASAQFNAVETATDILGVENTLLIKAGITQALEAGRLGNYKFRRHTGDEGIL